MLTALSGGPTSCTAKPCAFSAASNTVGGASSLGAAVAGGSEDEPLDPAAAAAGAEGVALAGGAGMEPLAPAAAGARATAVKTEEDAFACEAPFWRQGGGAFFGVGHGGAAGAAFPASAVFLGGEVFPASAAFGGPRSTYVPSGSPK